MDPQVLPLVVSVAVAGGAVGLALWNRARWSRAVHFVARALGLQFSPAHWNEPASARGRVGECMVTIAITKPRWVGRKTEPELTIVVDTRSSLDQLELSREGALNVITKIVTGDDIHAGSEEFDRAVRVSAVTEADGVSRLDHAVRKAAREVIGNQHATLARGAIELRSTTIFYNAEQLLSRVEAVLTLGRALTQQSSIRAERLAHNAMNDPEPRVRARNLGLLVEEHGATDETKRAIAHGLHDASEQVRVIAAAASGENGLDALLAIALDGGCRRADRVRALRAIGARLLTAEAAKPHAHAAETYLLGRLGDDDEELVEDAARALGAFAGLHAVAPLLPLTKGLTTARKVKDAAKHAIERIQARHAGESGRLSLVTEESAGRLSLPRGADHGALSTTPED